MSSTASVTVDSAVDESKWLYLLRTHIQEWKDHYNQVNQAIQDLEDEHQRVLSQLGHLDDDEQLAVVVDQDQQVDQLLNLYQLKRESIRERQQQEIADL